MLAAWNTYLHKYNRGRGVVLIGHSQGTYVLRELIHQAIDPRKKVRRQLVSAILLGGNVTAAAGSNVGGDFKHIPGCTRAKQIGCVIAFSTFDAPVPTTRCSAVPPPSTGPACRPPATCSARTRRPSAAARPRSPRSSRPQPFAPGTTIGLATSLVGVRAPTGATTPWFQVQGYTGACDAANNAHVLQISPVAGAPTLNAVPDATWGLHLVDANIALGNLTDDVAVEAKAWLKANSKRKGKKKHAVGGVRSRSRE